MAHQVALRILQIAGEESMLTRQMVAWMAAALGGPRARITGGVYLAYFLTAILAQFFVSRKLLVYGDAVNLIAYAFYIILTVLFYSMFRPVSRQLSLLAALFSLMGSAVGILDLFHRAPFHISPLLFFAFYCLLIGYFILRSTFLPGLLGWLMICAGAGWLLFLVPQIAKHLSIPIEALGVLAEASLMVWLLVKGVNLQRWHEQASDAEVSVYR